MKKVLSCILSFIPAISLFIAIVTIIVFSIKAETNVNFFDLYLVILMSALVILAVVSCYAVMIFYMVKACKNPNLTTGTKVLWCVLLYFLNIFIFPVFWFKYLKNEY